MQVNIHEAKTTLSRLIERAEQGEEIVLARAGRPVARLTALEPARTGRSGGFWKGRVRMAPDFDVLPPEVADAFEVDPVS